MQAMMQAITSQFPEPHQVPLAPKKQVDQGRRRPGKTLTPAEQEEILFAQEFPAVRLASDIENDDLDFYVPDTTHQDLCNAHRDMMRAHVAYIQALDQRRHIGGAQIPSFPSLSREINRHMEELSKLADMAQSF